MNFFTELSNYIIPLIIGIIMIAGVRDKIKVFDIFIKGATEGIEIVIKLMPTLIGIFFSIGMLRSSGIFDIVTRIVKPILKIIKFPPEIIPLALIRPISGSGAIGVATDLMKQYGVDSYIGNVASVIMGATETTIYTIAVYTSGLKVKKSKELLIASLSADVVGMIAAVVFCRILS
ncbi:MAG: spore maturation protein [Clostridia bacterium]|nr:spore maturation protein [Clostridia bacterium]